MALGQPVGTAKSLSISVIFDPRGTFCTVSGGDVYEYRGRDKSYQEQ